MWAGYQYPNIFVASNSNDKRKDIGEYWHELAVVCLDVAAWREYIPV